MRLVIESEKKKIIEGQLKIYQTLNVKPETSSEKRAESNEKKIKTERNKKRNKRFRSKK